MSIVIVDWGMGNLGSIRHKLQRIGITATVTSDAAVITDADKLILPGVGAFKAGMANLRERNLISVLNVKVLQDKTPILGICLGMQLFAEHSEEGEAEGLGWIAGDVKRFSFEVAESPLLRVPHVGWNTIQPHRTSPVLADLTPGQHFYFTHSYYLQCHNNEDIVATTLYGHEFVSVLQHENIYGVQFHPEKSHKEGLNIIRNFVESAPC
jgi:imidazole glycerol-phosphate synthase subunit HisH